jgi:hypothetical protein
VKVPKYPVRGRAEASRSSEVGIENPEKLKTENKSHPQHCEYIIAFLSSIFLNMYDLTSANCAHYLSH